MSVQAPTLAGMTAVAPPPTVTLSADQARRIALRAQGLLGSPDRRAGVRGVLRHLGAVQLDTISVLARSHELVPYARLGAVGRPAVEHAYWGAGASFEYWSHAACVLPIEEWPLFAFRRRAYRDRGNLWSHQVSEQAYRAVLDRLRAEGPLTSTELGGAKRTAEWWDWSESKVAVERALAFGDVVCTERRGWKRVYALAEHAVPAELFERDPSDRECLARLVRQAGRALGVATRADLADYHRLKSAQLDAVLAESGLLPVAVAGWGPDGAEGPAWADPAVLDRAEAGGRHRTTLLSPFDSLVWDRARTERIFGMAHRLEAYTPSPSGYTATSRCRCSPAAGWSAGWTRPARGAPWWPGGSRWTRRAISRRWQGRCARPPSGWAAQRCASRSCTTRRCGRHWRSCSPIERPGGPAG